MELKPIDRTDKGRNRLNAALSIYRETIFPEAQNPERQILYWIDHSKDELSDEFRCFALERSRRVVGYLQYSYFGEEHIFFFEYLCICDKSPRGLVPNEAMDVIASALAQNYRPGYTIVFEIAQKRASPCDWIPDKVLIKYFQRIGFRKVTFDYRYPVLQSYDGVISYPADLMVRLPDSRATITASEMRTILRCIYFKHYLRWDRPFLDPIRFSERERLINELYSKEVMAIENDDTFGTTGTVRRSKFDVLKRVDIKIVPLLERIFSPKLPRIATVMALLLFTQWLLGSSLLLIPFIITAAAVYCLAEDTDASRKLFVTVLTKLKSGPPR